MSRRSSSRAAGEIYHCTWWRYWCRWGIMITFSADVAFWALLSYLFSFRAGFRQKRHFLIYMKPEVVFSIIGTCFRGIFLLLLLQTRNFSQYFHWNFIPTYCFLLQNRFELTFLARASSLLIRFITQLNIYDYSKARLSWHASYFDVSSEFWQAIFLYIAFHSLLPYTLMMPSCLSMIVILFLDFNAWCFFLFFLYLLLLIRTRWPLMAFISGL